jgi:hypothetical protein
LSQPGALIDGACKALLSKPLGATLKPLLNLVPKLLGNSPGLRSLTDDADATVADIVNPGQFSRPLSFYGNTG